jgi:pimeloyl-ACP methyl ester carboxylesterase
MKPWPMADRQTLILLCGIAGDTDSWSEVATLLGQDAECRILVATGDSIAAMADDILARTPGPIAVAGHSLGGYGALAPPRAAPGRVTRLALVNSSAAPDNDDARAARLKTIEAVASRGYEAIIRQLTPALAHPDSRIDPTRVQAMLSRAGPTRFIREQYAAMDRPDARPALRLVDLPVVVIGAEADRIIAPARSIEIAEIAPGATLVMLAASGHLSPMEQPALVGDAMGKWLKAGLP